MRTDSSDLGRLSPTLAAAFLGCGAAAAWTLEARQGLRARAKLDEDPGADLIVRKGFEHEAICLAGLRERVGTEVEMPKGSLEQRFAATVAAMDRGAPLIYQAALTHGPWLGYADFLVRTDKPCPRWTWSYEPWDAKLARSARPEHLLQIAIYGDLLSAVQGRRAPYGALMLGTGQANTPYAVERFRLKEVRYYVARVAGRLERFAADLPSGLTPEPCGHCGKCEWTGACEVRWDEADHLCRVADIRRTQIRRLTDGGVSTLAALSNLDGVRIGGIAPETLARLAQQARLQRDSAATGTGMHEVLPHSPGCGFDRLPPPDPDDLFFDFEGDPMHPGGLEYLCGVLWRVGSDDREGDPVPGHPLLRFRAFWAHDRDEEKQAFSALMTFLMSRLKRSPGAHLYHYAPYEKTALRRLASMHATAEAAVDDLLRGERTVDLYRVVREGVRVGEPSYSIKSLERFYMPARDTAVASGGDSLVIYDRYRQTGASSLLNDLRDYNRDDCLSTSLLRDWLLERAKEAGRWPPARPAEPDDAEAADQQSATRAAAREARELEQAELENALLATAAPTEREVHQLMADLVGFHQREAKPAWWAFFDRRSASAEALLDDDECLGGCVADGEDWIGQEKKSLTFRFRYLEQETKLRAGSAVHLSGSGDAIGKIVSLDEVTRTLVLKRGAAKGPLP